MIKSVLIKIVNGMTANKVLFLFSRYKMLHKTQEKYNIASGVVILLTRFIPNTNKINGEIILYGLLTCFKLKYANKSTDNKIKILGK